MSVPSPEKLRKLARELRALAEKPIADSAERRAWYATARELQEWITADPVLSDAIPHMVWHYLGDADIRARDPAYRQEQTLQLLEILGAFDRGEVPGD